MQQEETYGAEFVRHLTALGRQTPYNYKDLQQVKAMTQTDLSAWLRAESGEFSRTVLAHTPEDAAIMVHKKRMEMAAALAGSSSVHGVASFLELCVYLFSAAH